MAASEGVIAENSEREDASMFEHGGDFWGDDVEVRKK